MQSKVTMVYDQASPIPTEVFNLAVDSNFRDTQKHPNHWQYVVNFDNVFKNVVSVELVMAVYEKVTTDAYVNLYIDELSPNLYSNSNPIKGSFTQLPLTDTLNTYTRDKYRSIKQFVKPLSKLHKMSIRFVSPNGSSYPIRDHFLRFEVTCMKFQATPEWKNLEIVGDSVNMFRAHNDEGWNARNVLELPEVFTEEMIKKNFVKKAKLYKTASPEMYEKCKRAFKELFPSTLVQSTPFPPSH